MLKNISKLLLFAFPLGLAGAITKSYTLRISDATTFQVIGIWDGLLIGSVTTVTLLGFLMFVHLKLFRVPDDLFTGPMFAKTGTGPLFGGTPAIFRQAMATVLCMSGAGFGFILSSLILQVDVFGTGISMLMPGITGSVFLTALWKSRQAR